MAARVAVWNDLAYHDGMHNVVFGNLTVSDICVLVTASASVAIYFQLRAIHESLLDIWIGLGLHKRGSEDT